MRHRDRTPGRCSSRSHTHKQFICCWLRLRRVHQFRRIGRTVTCDFNRFHAYLSGPEFHGCKPMDSRNRRDRTAWLEHWNIDHDDYRCRRCQFMRSLPARGLLAVEDLTIISTRCNNHLCPIDQHEAINKQGPIALVIRAFAKASNVTPAPATNAHGSLHTFPSQVLGGLAR